MTTIASMRGFGKVPSFTKSIPKIMAAIQATAKEVVSDFEAHTAHYSGGVKIEIKEITPFEVEIFTKDERVCIVSVGAKPHIIKARDGGNLAFQSDYVAKTTPSAIPSRPGGKSGEFVYPQQVKHPGFEPRHTERQIADHVRPGFIRLMLDAVRG